MVVGKVRPVSIEEEMRSSYSAYAMSVVVARALVGTEYLNPVVS